MQQFKNVAFAIIIAAIVVVLMRDESNPAGLGNAVVPSSVNTRQFDGHYRLVEEESFRKTRALVAAEEHEIAKQIMVRGLPDPQLLLRTAYLRFGMCDSVDSCTGFTINSGVIRSGQTLPWELSLLDAKITGNKLLGTALLHEDVHDPGDCQEVSVMLERDGKRLKFNYFPESEKPTDWVVFEHMTPSDRGRTGQ
jgi:hypothetical protein